MPSDINKYFHSNCQFFSQHPWHELCIVSSKFNDFCIFSGYISLRKISLLNNFDKVMLKLIHVFNESVKFSLIFFFLIEQFLFKFFNDKVVVLSIYLVSKVFWVIFFIDDFQSFFRVDFLIRIKDELLYVFDPLQYHSK